MDREFHYWVTGLIAEYAGFSPKDCRTIAYSSQYTDDNNVTIEVYANDAAPEPSFRTHVSQTENILKPQREILNIYPIFHFIPGDMAKAPARKDGQTYPLITTPDSSHANKIFAYTLSNSVSRYLAKDRRCLYRVGLAAHSYVDTWAHQNFCGYYSDMNGLPGVLLPDIGHFDAMHNPDMVNHQWTDDRLVNSIIINNDRFIAAAKRLYGYFVAFCAQINCSPRGSWEDLENLLLFIWKKDKDDRIKNYRKATKHVKGYDERLWINEATELIEVEDISTENTRVEKRVWQDPVNYVKTDWYGFQEEVKGHIADATTILRPVFREAGFEFV